MTHQPTQFDRTEEGCGPHAGLLSLKISSFVFCSLKTLAPFLYQCIRKLISCWFLLKTRDKKKRTTTNSWPVDNESVASLILLSHCATSVFCVRVLDKVCQTKQCVNDVKQREASSNDIARHHSFYPDQRSGNRSRCRVRGPLLSIPALCKCFLCQRQLRQNGAGSLGYKIIALKPALQEQLVQPAIPMHPTPKKKVFLIPCIRPPAFQLAHNLTFQQTNYKRPHATSELQLKTTSIYGLRIGVGVARTTSHYEQLELVHHQTPINMYLTITLASNFLGTIYI